MKTVMLILLFSTLSVAAGYYWAFQTYKPLELAQENKELRQEVDEWNRAFTKQFSKPFIGLIPFQKKSRI